MKLLRLLIFLSCALLGSITHQGFAQTTQTNKGINFQGIARDNNGYIIANKSINIRISIKADTFSSKI